MSVVWKVLAVLLLTLPPAAYVAGAIVGPPDMVSARDREPVPSATTEVLEQPDKRARGGPARQAAQAPTEEGGAAAIGPGRAPRPVEQRESPAARTPTEDAQPQQQGARALRVSPPRGERDTGPGEVRVVPPASETGEATPTPPAEPPTADAPEDAVTVLPDGGSGETPDDSVTVAPDPRDDR